MNVVLIYFSNNNNKCRKDKTATQISTINPSHPASCTVDGIHACYSHTANSVNPWFKLILVHPT